MECLGTNGGMRLRGGIVPEAGTVEYCTGGTWKAVCDYNWGYKDSFVVCRQLGFPATGNKNKSVCILSSMIHPSYI